MSAGIVASGGKRFVRAGEPFKAVMPHSEVMISMGMAGQEVELAILPATLSGQDAMIMKNGVAAAQVTLGEAGISTDGLRFWVPNHADLPVVSGPSRRVPVL